MKYSQTPQFEADFRRLTAEHRSLFKQCFPDFSEACDAYAAQDQASWPARFRVRPMAGRSGIWEMTWSFSGPDGRATFEFLQEDGETRIRWRRIGDHSVYKKP